MTDHQLGDAPIEAQHHQLMNELAHALDAMFNGNLKGKARKTGFILMVFPFEGGTPGARCNYISNANRADVVTMLKEQIARFEGQPEVTGKA